MTVENTNDFLGGGDTLHARLWRELEQAVADRQHSWRTPVLASVDAVGQPQARTVVLREVRAASEQLLVYTDARSPKVAELRSRPKGSLLCWCPRLSWQLRMQLTVKVLLDGPEVQQAWERVKQSPSASDYLAPRAPGAPMMGAPEEDLTSPQLAVLLCQVDTMDWLELRREGHRRARLSREGVSWLVP